MGQHRVFITGCSGYLGQNLIKSIRDDSDIAWLGGNDIRPPSDIAGWHFFRIDVNSPRLTEILREHRVDTVVHLAWIFNPTHQPDLEYRVDVEGTRNVLQAAKSADVEYLIYLSSTTSYGPHPDNPPLLKESDPTRGHRGYLYSRYKAEVDQMVRQFMKSSDRPRIFMVRAPIVLGPRTQNIVSMFTGLPVMVGVRGYDPPMQFVHENDMTRLLAWAIKHRPEGVYNFSGQGTVRYSEIARMAGKRLVRLPIWILSPVMGLLWSLRLIPFPPSMLDFIRYPWVASTEKFDSTFDFRCEADSKQAVLDFVRARWPDRVRE